MIFGWPKMAFWFLALTLIDQITKAFADRDFFVGPMHWHLVKNYGLGFGLDFGFTNNLIILIITGAILFWLLRKPYKAMEQICFTLIAAGAFSNILDRLMFGYVRDFLDLGLGFSFNFADGYIFAGIAGILISESWHFKSWK